MVFLNVICILQKLLQGRHWSKLWQTLFQSQVQRDLLFELFVWLYLVLTIQQISKEF